MICNEWAGMIKWVNKKNVPKKQWNQSFISVNIRETVHTETVWCHMFTVSGSVSTYNCHTCFKKERE